MQKLSRASLGPLIVFALLTIGADNCALTMIGEPVPPRPQKPFCETDPPYGCIAICVGPDDVALSGNCGDVGAAALTQQFQMDIDMLVQAAQQVGMQFCTPDMMFVTVTPCQVGIIPKQQVTSDACMPVPPNCAP